jgi:hypothetical protein
MTRGTFLWSFQFVFRLPAEGAQALLPPTLTPLTRDGWAYLNVAIGEFEAFRPAARPFKVGRSGHIAVVRVYAQQPGIPDIGFYGLRAICDDARSLGLMQRLATAPAEQELIEVFDDTVGTVQLQVDAETTPTSVSLDTRGKPKLSEGSPFASLSEAATFLKPPTRLFARNADGIIVTAEVDRVEEGRGAKKRDHRLVRVPRAEWGLPEVASLPLEICFDIAPLHYRWPTGFALAP